jgi:hypothetical protein
MIPTDQSIVTTDEKTAAALAKVRADATDVVRWCVKDKEQVDLLLDILGLNEEQVEQRGPLASGFDDRALALRRRRAQAAANKRPITSDR